MNRNDTKSRFDVRFSHKATAAYALRGFSLIPNKCVFDRKARVRNLRNQIIYGRSVWIRQMVY